MNRARPTALAALAGLVLLAGCANVDARRRDDAERAAQRASAALGAAVEPVLAADDDGAIAPRALELLQEALTEERAVEIALVNHRGVRAAFERLGVSSAHAARATRPANPVLSAQWLEFDAGSELAVGIAQPLFELLQMSRRRARAAASHDAQEVELVATVLGLSFAARRAYADAQHAEQRAALERRLLRAAEIAHELMLDLHRAGNVVDIELTVEELALSDARLELARAESAAREAREPLNEALGLWGASSGWQLAEAVPLAALPADALETVEARAIEASLDLERTRARMRAQAANAGIESWDAVLSNFELGLAAQRDPDLDDTGIGPSLSIALPVFDAGSPARAAALGTLRALAADHAVLTVAIRAEARRLRERVLAADVRVAALRDEHVPMLRRFVMDTLRNYNAMQIGAFDVVRARRLELDGERELVRSEADARRARLELEELLAGRLARRTAPADADDSPASDATSHMQPGGGH